MLFGLDGVEIGLIIVFLTLFSAILSGFPVAFAIGGAGVMFTIDTESGFDKVVLINAARGLGETVVQGTVTPDEYQVFKPLLDDPALCPIVEKSSAPRSES